MSRNIVSIAASGAIQRWGQPERDFGIPKALLSLGEETVVDRLVRQCVDNDAIPVIAIGKAGEGGWELEHVEAFRSLDCHLIESPYGEARSCTSTDIYLLEYIRDEQIWGESLAPDDKVFMIPADWVMKDSLFSELMGYPAPCVFGFRGISDRSTILNQASIPLYIDLQGRYQTSSELISKEMDNLARLGFQYLVRTLPEQFVEIDFVHEVDAAQRLAQQGVTV